MSQTPDPEFDLEQLFLPAWAKQPATNKFASFAGGEDRPRRDDRGPGSFRRDNRGPRPQRREDGRPGGPRRDGPRRDGPPGRDRGPGPIREERREQGPPLPDLAVSFLPEEAGVEALAKQIRLTGRAYPLFEIAQLILRKAERFQIRLAVNKKPDGEPVQPLFLCGLDETVWLSEAEIAGHLLHRHFDTFYTTERVAGELPKGTYTFVAQCGMSGTVLGPPNYHGYQEKLRHLHAERFSRMPFEVFKARVKIVKDETVVKQWLEDQSYKTTFIALNVPEPLTFNTREEVEKHFRETHLHNLFKRVDSHTVTGVAARALPCLPLRQLTRSALDDQSRFPLNIATLLSQQFSGQGLHFFKVNKTVTHVCVARPAYLDLENTPVSERVRSIMEFIGAHGKCTRRQLLAALAPTPAQPAAPVTKPADPGAAGVASTAPAEPATTPGQDALNADLHWLVHEGHVIEFATNGILETAKKPLPRPEKPKNAAPQPANNDAATSPSTPTEAPAAPVADSGPEAELPEQTEPALPAMESATAPEPAPAPVTS